MCALFFNAVRSTFLLFFCYLPFGTHPTSSSKLRQQKPSFPSEEEETDEQEEEEESSSQSMTR